MMATISARADNAPWSKRRSTAQAWRPSDKPTVFVVPHPDDEVLLMGGLLSLIQHGRPETPKVMLAVTDGEAAYPELDSSALAETRRAEQSGALRAIGAGDQLKVVRLEIPDSAVHEHEQLLDDVLGELVDETWRIVAPWRHDHHSDHEACGRSASRVAKAAGCEFIEGLFWAWQHPVPPGTPCLRRLRLSPSVVAGRAAAIAQHQSQLVPAPRFDPILTESDLLPLSWANEYYFVTEQIAR